MGRIKFDEFELDCDRYQLLRSGTNVKLEKIPMELLILLVSKNGHLATRQEIVERLWGSDVFVDTEHGINTAVRKIRQALGDDPEQPRFVQTVTGKGYRFIAAVTVSGNGAGNQAFVETVAAPWRGPRLAGSEAQSEEDLSSAIPPLPRNGDQEKNPANGAGLSVSELAREERKLHPVGKRLAWLVVGGLVLLSAAAVIVKRTQPARLAIRDTIVIADFANTTGDAVFDDTLKTALSVSLRQSPFLNILSDSEVSQTLQQMTRPGGTKLTPEIARELCQRAGSKAYIAGAIALLGSEYVLGLKAVNCQSGDILVQHQVTAASKEKVLDSLGGAASRLRGELGESLASVQKFDVPLEQATTSSLEALRAHSLGRKADRENGPIAALPYDLRAVEIDPNFAIGYLVLGGDFEDRDQRGRASEYYRKAFQLREHASERERLRITGVFYDTVTGELDKAAEAYRQGAESYPSDSFAFFSLAYVYCMLGQYEKAIAVSRQGIQRAPYTVHHLGPETVFLGALALQRLDEAEQAIRDLQSRPGNEERVHIYLYMLAIVRGDSAALREQAAWLLGSPNFENYVWALDSDTEAYAGRLQRSRELTRRAVEAAVRADSRETAGEWEAHSAQRVAAYGNLAEGRQIATHALKFAPESRAVESEVAFAAAIAADTERAQSLVHDLEKRSPLDTQVQALWLPTIRAQLELNRGNPARAIDELRVASTIEYALMPTSLNISCLPHDYVRGEVYLAAGQGGAAAAEFQKILHHRGIVWNCWTGAMARLGLARANALESRSLQGSDAEAARARALAAYKDFLTLWKDADPDIPVLKQAKAEYARLQ